MYTKKPFIKLPTIKLRKGIFFELVWANGRETNYYFCISTVFSIHVYHMSKSGNLSAQSNYAAVIYQQNYNIKVVDEVIELLRSFHSLL